MPKKYHLKIRPGGWCWIGVAVGVFIADAVLIETKHATMSEVFGDALKHPHRRWPVILAWGVLSLHLFGNLLPRIASPIKRLDPIGYLARLLTPHA